MIDYLGEERGLRKIFVEKMRPLLVASLEDATLISFLKGYQGSEESTAVEKILEIDDTAMILRIMGNRLVGLQMTNDNVLIRRADVIVASVNFSIVFPSDKVWRINSAWPRRAQRELTTKIVKKFS